MDETDPLKVTFFQGHHVFRHQKLIKRIFHIKKYNVLILVVLPKNNDLNGDKLSQNIFHFQSPAIFFKIDQFSKFLHISVVSLPYDAF